MKPLPTAVYESECFVPDYIQMYKNLRERVDLVYVKDDEPGQDELGQGVVLNFLDNDWEHLCFGIQEPKIRVPSYEEMAEAKDAFWYCNEIAMQIHPRESDNVSIYEMLHLWRNRSISEDAENNLRGTIERAYNRAKQHQNTSSQYIIDLEDNIKKLFVYCGDKWFCWDEICKAKKKYFGKDKAAVQFNIGREFDLNPEHIMILWDAEDFILPPKELV